ncbi:MAG TPA: hypothetical protein VFK78_01460, partial [Gemmatimonadales bacterium]|nr:hypothetical protein [Gemmatimonadales bacterium]
MRAQTFCIALATAAIACRGPATPVPVVGRQADISRLTGEWLGSYSSVESGRSGSIVFELTAGSDTAQGDVMMGPAGWNGPVPRGRPINRAQLPPATQVLTINFVRISGGQVSGALASYTDPSCDCQVHTTFVGTLAADTLA